MDKKTVKDVPVCDRRVLVRVDFNVPINEQTGEITDDSRIRVLPTINTLPSQCKSNPMLTSWKALTANLITSIVWSQWPRGFADLREEVLFATDCVGPEVQSLVNSLNGPSVLLLENLRFYSEEESNSPVFARELAKLGDVYVNDAYGTSHRKHSSIVGVTEYLPSVAGLLLEKEINSLGLVLQKPRRPFGVLLGGAKVSDKVKLLDNVMDKVDYIIVGGGMAATFLQAMGHEVGRSLIDDSLDTARMLIDKVAGNGVKLILPDDVMVTESINPPAPAVNVPISKIPQDKMIVDMDAHHNQIYETLEKCRLCS